MGGTTALLWLAVACSIFPSTQALQLVKKSEPAVVGFDIERVHVANPIEHDIQRRQSKIVNQTLDNNRTLYYVNITLGTPAQRLRLHIDTGSSDLWCNSRNSRICSSRRNPCKESGTYSANSSSTYKFKNSKFNITYADGTGAVGDYVTDTLRLSNATLKDFQFGVGYESSSQEGVLGIGYMANEVQVAQGGKSYPNLPQAMVDDKLIHSKAYSLWLNDLDASKGSILFGGVNKAKYVGNLSTVPILKPKKGPYQQLVIAMTGINMKGSSNGQNLSSGSLPVAALLDSGSTLMYLPDAIAANIYETIGATYEPSLGAAYVPCNMSSNNTKLEFEFSGATISVGMDELVIDLSPSQDGNGPTFTNGEPACTFGIAPAGSGTCILGDTFLRSAYVVYDLSNHEISIAQTKFNSTTNDIHEIGTGKTAVPGAQTVSSAVTSVPATKTQGRPHGGPTGSGTVTSLSFEVSAAMAAPMVLPQLSVGMVAGLVGAGIMFAAM
ncbi:hypothetical protein AJ80_07422 [Polytolypa hystricis UAMH7299]|uniref:Probable aspartic-type endopeptidase OPSB n=1 Tax=Polytolypa hystricis (strain UAMH7299) TaxID=1447883 RepID=A0A2B7XQ50_POLH7|nr:hypothetical protein AJ80_07422 [Polytolypa hystricis UAMH7299]